MFIIIKTILQNFISENELEIRTRGRKEHDEKMHGVKTRERF